MSKLVHIIGGGTVAHVRPHFALSAPAYGGTARWIYQQFAYGPQESGEVQEFSPVLHLTRMADSTSKVETNEDIGTLVDSIVANPESKIVYMTAALCDWDPVLMQDLESTVSETIFGVGKDHPRLKTAEFQNGGLGVLVKPSDKVIGRIRKVRKDIFLVGFKTTTGATPGEQFNAGLGLLKGSSCNLVLANDLKTGLNMIVTPEEARYAVSTDRQWVLGELHEMATHRSRLTFTRSKVVDEPLIGWSDSRIPHSLRTVVNHCIKQGAYKPFQGKTVGHFAVNLPGSDFITSIRKSDFNKLNKTGMVFATASGKDKVIAHGAKPSVGGQSQRIIFEQHPDQDCIVHFHCPLREGREISMRSQKFFECGSHECGQNTSDGLQDYSGIKAVMLDKHGPNIVFNKSTDPAKVIDFIEENWDLGSSTRL